MEFSKVTKEVNEKLKSMSLEDRVSLFKNLFNYPIDYKDGVYSYGAHEWDETRMSDFLEVNMHWMSVKEFDYIHYHFTKNNLF
jgi:hypothetical protein